MKKMIVTLFLVMVLSACSNSGELKQIDLDTFDSFLSGKEDGFLFVTYDPEEEYVPYVEDATEKTKAEINFYHLHQPDGKDGEVLEDPVFEGKVENDLKKEHLYYLENGKASDPIDLTAYDEGAELSQRIQNFIEIFNK